MGLPPGGLVLLGGVALLLAVGCSGASSSSRHSLRYFHTGLSEPGQGLPQLIIVGYVDDQPFVKYDSDGRKMLPQVPWMEEFGKEDPQYWEGQSQRAQRAEPAFRASLETARQRYNQSRGEAPVARVARKKGYDGQETLFCQLYGFYPKEIEVTWMKDGEERMETLTGGVVPNSDGTYNKWLSIEVDPKEKDRYRCRVGHDSLLEPLNLAWEEPASNLGLILGIVGALLAALILVGAAGVAFYLLPVPEA